MNTSAFLLLLLLVILIIFMICNCTNKSNFKEEYGLKYKGKNDSDIDVK